MLSCHAKTEPGENFESSDGNSYFLIDLRFWNTVYIDHFFTVFLIAYGVVIGKEKENKNICK